MLRMAFVFILMHAFFKVVYTEVLAVCQDMCVIFYTKAVFVVSALSFILSASAAQLLSVVWIPY